MQYRTNSYSLRESNKDRRKIEYLNYDIIKTNKEMWVFRFEQIEQIECRIL